MNFLSACTRRLSSTERTWLSARLVRHPTPHLNTPTGPSSSSCRHHSTIFRKLRYVKHNPNDEYFIQFMNKLIYVLRRESGREYGLENRYDDYVSVKLLLSHPEFQSISMAALQKIIDSDNKHRCSLKFDPTKQEDSWWIRARKWNEPYYYLKPIRPGVKPISHAVYRTNIQEWNDHISTNGIPRLDRDYTTLECGISTEHYLENMESTDEVFVFVDVEACMQAGIRFYTPTPPPQPTAKPTHLVTKGDEYGYIRPHLFAEAERVRTNKSFLWGDPDHLMQSALLPPEKIEKKKNPPTYLRVPDHNLTGFVHFPAPELPHPDTIEEAKALLATP